MSIMVRFLILQVEDDVFEGLSKLEILSLKDNNILLVPASALGCLPSLTALQLDYNRVAALSGDILRAVASHVMTLSLAHNVVRELLPTSFKEFTQLEVLNLSGNLLTNVAATTFTGLEETLVVLNLSGNHLTLLSSVPIVFPQLKVLDVSQNQLAEISCMAFTHLPTTAWPPRTSQARPESNRLENSITRTPPSQPEP